MDDEIYHEIEALLQAVQGYCNEQLTGVPADVSNPIVDTYEMFDAVQRVHALIQTIAPGQANHTHT